MTVAEVNLSIKSWLFQPFLLNNIKVYNVRLYTSLSITICDGCIKHFITAQAHINNCFSFTFAHLSIWVLTGPRNLSPSYYVYFLLPQMTVSERNVEMWIFQERSMSRTEQKSDSRKSWHMTVQHTVMSLHNSNVTVLFSIVCESEQH